MNESWVTQPETIAVKIILFSKVVKQYNQNQAKGKVLKVRIMRKNDASNKRSSPFVIFTMLLLLNAYVKNKATPWTKFQQFPHRWQDYCINDTEMILKQLL